MPSRDALKQKKVTVLPSKVQYLQRCLNSSLKYLDDETLKKETTLVIETYLVALSKKGFSLLQSADSSKEQSSSEPSLTASVKASSKSEKKGGNVG